MPFHQTTLSFSKAVPVNKAAAAMTKTRRPVRQEPTPELDSDHADNSSPAPMRVPLPTPSESSTDVSSQASDVQTSLSPQKTRSRRVATRKPLPRSASKPDLPIPVESLQTRTISGDTLVDSPGASPGFLKDSIDKLDLQWNMSNVFRDPSDKEASPSDQLQAEAEEEQARVKKQEANRKRSEQAKKLWDARRKKAAKAATRKSTRAPASIMTKATEVIKQVANTVLGKRSRESKPVDEEEESSAKKQRTDEVSLSEAARAIKARGSKNKKWLISGLYAGQSSNFDPTKTGGKNKRKSGQDEDLSENKVLPMPMFAGDRMLKNGRDFKLPFDVFSPLPAGQPKPDEWRKTNKNVFVGDAAGEWRDTVLKEHSTCLCTTTCDAECLNRYMYYECTGANCNLTTEKCTNRAFADLHARVKKGGKYNVGVEVIKTKDRGYGVRSNRTFEPNQIIVEYTGEILTTEDCERRMHTLYKDNECYYLMAFDQATIIDATRGSIARFVNHSCAPNCRMEKWTVAGKPRMALFAGDSGIMTGEELTYDYNFDPYSAKNVQVCRCGAPNCRQILGPRPKEPKKDTDSDDGVKRSASKASKIGKVSKGVAGAKRKLAEAVEALAPASKKPKSSLARSATVSKLSKLAHSRNSNSHSNSLLPRRLGHSLPLPKRGGARTARAVSGVSSRALLAELHEMDAAASGRVEDVTDVDTGAGSARKGRAAYRTSSAGTAGTRSSIDTNDRAAEIADRANALMRRSRRSSAR